MSPMVSCIVGRKPGYGRQCSFVQGERPGDRLATGFDGEHRLPTEQDLQQLESESGHCTLQLGGSLLVGGACRIHRACSER